MTLGVRLQIWGGWIVAAGSLALAAWLGSSVLTSRWAIFVEDERVVVRKGTRLPMIFEDVDDPNPRLRAAYAPVERPAGFSAIEGEFDDRDALDRALFAMLTGWARALAGRGDEASQALAVDLIARAALLPSLSPAEEAELEELRAKVGMAEAKREIARAVGSLRAARKGLLAAIRAGGKQAVESATLVERLEQPLDLLLRLGARRAAADGSSDVVADPR